MTPARINFILWAWSNSPNRPADRATIPLRERLLDAAARVFAQKGYSGTRILDVVAEAGLSTGAVYGRFSSKNDLLREAVSSRSASRASGDVDRASKVADLFGSAARCARTH